MGREADAMEHAEDGVEDGVEDWAGDWRTIWQSELAALAVDREAHEAVARTINDWRPADATPRADAPSRSPAAAAAPGLGEAAGLADVVGQLDGRVAELERRLAEHGAP